MLGFWLATGGMALAVAFLMARPLLGPVRQTGDSADMALYRAQLAEIERDLARGTLPASEAERARAEVARRLIAADRAGPADPAATGGHGVALAALALACGGAFLAYDRLGAPGYPDLGLADRIAAADARMADRPGQAQAAAEAAPLLPAPPVPDAEFAALMDTLRAAVDPATATDPEGLRLLARNEGELGRYPQAAAAQARLIEVKGATATADDHILLAEILITAAGGYISPEAEASVTTALGLDPAHGPARYYAGELFHQGGRFDRAFALWQDLLADSPPGAPWVGPVLARMPDTAARAGVAWSPPRGLEAATEDEQAMIEAMVAGLSERLATEGGSAEEWARLVRSLGVLGRQAEAQSVYDEAKLRFRGMSVELQGLAEAAVSAGLAP